MNMFRAPQVKKEEEKVPVKTKEIKITYVNLDRNAKLIMAVIKGLELGSVVKFLRNKDEPQLLNVVLHLPPGPEEDMPTKIYGEVAICDHLVQLKNSKACEGKMIYEPNFMRLG